MIHRILLTISLVSCLTILGAQTDKKIVPVAEAGLGLGGQFYLNYLESNPMYFVRVGILSRSSEKASISFIAGYEALQQESFIPLLFRYTYGINNRFYGHFGYALGLRSDIDDLREYDFRGGLAIGAGYDRLVWQKENLELLLFAGYEFRAAVLNFETAGPGADVSSDLEFHFFSLGIKSEF